MTVMTKRTVRMGGRARGSSSVVVVRWMEEILHRPDADL